MRKAVIFACMSLDERQSASREQFEKQSRNYGRTHILADTSDIVEALGDIHGTGAPALDVATGGGHTAVFLARQGFRVTASDLSPAMLARCQELATEAGVEVCTAEHAAEALPYPGETFGLVSCRVAAHHFSNPKAFVNEAARVLRRGGTFLLIDGSIPDGAPEVEEWLHRVEKLRDPSHGRFLSPSTWTHLCESAGLSVELCTTTPLKQPNLEWYFETAGTSAANREAVRELVAGASTAVIETLGLATEEGKTVWWWPRLTLRARKP